METPVAPTGWPLALRPPEGLTGSRPSFSVQPSATARAPWPRLVRPMASYSSSSAMVKQSRSEEHTSELQSLMRISYAVFCLKKKRTNMMEFDFLGITGDRKAKSEEQTYKLQSLIRITYSVF